MKIINSYMLVGDTLINLDELIVFMWIYIVSLPIAIPIMLSKMGEIKQRKRINRKFVKVSNTPTKQKGFSCGSDGVSTYSYEW